MKKLALVSFISFGSLFMSAAAASAYTVEKGDTMSHIATNHGVSLDSLISHNPSIKNPNLIFPKQYIEIPNGESKPVAKKSKKTVEAAKVSKEPAKTSETPSTKGVSNGELDLLERLVEAEAAIEPFEGKVAVAQVVLNRVESGKFPNSISDVIYQPRQFTPVSNGMINRTASSDSKKAVQIALNTGGNANGAMYFYDPRYASGQSWFNTLSTAKVIGNHVFKY